MPEKCHPPFSYLGAMGTEGFSPGIVAKLAAELQQAMPQIFAPHSLQML